MYIKKLAKYILTFPQVLICRLKGINTPWSDLVTFFRYFPFGKINKDNSVDINYRNHPVKFFYDDLGPMLAGEFAGNDYDKLPVEGVEVLDIGASCGDTPIIFALRGASKVVGYELNERYFNLSRRNVEVNNLSNKVNLKLSGVAAKKIESADEILAAIVPERDRSSVGTAEFKMLNEIVIDNRFTSSTVMKMDVDGYEYEIFRSTSIETLKTFSHISLEYHFGLQDIPSILKSAGFTVEVVPIIKTSISHHPENYKNMEIGLIHAHRI